MTDFGSYLRFDRRAVELAVLLLVVAGTAAVITMPAPEAVDTQPADVVGDVTGSQSGNEAATGAGWAVLEAALAVGILGVLILARRLPDWIRTTAYRAFTGSLLFIYGAYAAARGELLTYHALAVLAYATYRTMDHYRVYWLANNALVVVAAVGVGIVLGSIFGVVGLLAALAVLTLYDHLFADRSDAMFDLARAILRFRLPVIFVRPTTWRLPWSALMDAELDDGEQTPGIGWGIGTADLMVGAAFVTAVATTPAFLGIEHTAGTIGLVLAGLAVSALRLSHELETKGGGAGLPAISAGAVGAYGVALAMGAVLA